MIEFNLSITSGSRWAQTRIARLVDRDANDCAISPPLQTYMVFRELNIPLSTQIFFFWKQSGLCIPERPLPVSPSANVGLKFGAQINIKENKTPSYFS